MDGSLSEFMDKLRQAQGTAEAAVLRAQLFMAQAIETKVQDNIKKTFAIGSPGRSRFVTASAGGAARNGGLFGSVTLAADGDKLRVSVGGTGVPYAAIQEEGGIVTPKKSKYLTIPVSPDARKRRVADFGIANLEMGVDPIWGLSFHMRSTGEVMFALRRKATIPARPYFQPAVQEVANEETLRAGFKHGIGGSLDLEIK